MFDLSQHQSKGTKLISLVSGSGSTSSGHRIAIVAPGGPKQSKKKVHKALAAHAGSQMAIALTGAKTSRKKKAGVKKTKGGVRKRGSSSTKITIAKGGRVRLLLASGDRKTVSAVALVRKLPIATVVKAAQSIRRKSKKKGGKKKKRKTKKH